LANDKDVEKYYIQQIAILQERVRVLEKQLEKKVLQGRHEIMDTYLWSEHIFNKWVKMGLPVLLVDRMYYAHKDNINEYFKGMCRGNYKNTPDNIIEAGE